MQVRREPGREAQEGEDHVLDPLAHVGLPARLDLVRLLPGEVEQDGDVVRAERPERVLVRAQLPEVEPVRVEVVDLAELAAVGDLLELRDARVVLEQVADHQRPPGLARRVDGPLGVRDGLGERLLDEAVLAGAQDLLRQRRVGGDRRRQDDRVERVVGEQVRQVGGPARGRDRRPDPLQRGGVAVAQPGELAAGDRREVAREVRAPVAQPRHADRDRRHSPILRASAAATRLPACPSP